jgi:large subunit ribosomal protein L21
MFAVIETGGKQYLVSAGKKIKIEKLEVKKGEKVSFDKVLLVFDKEAEIGAPYVKGAKVSAVVVRQSRHEKIIVGRFRPKKRQHKKKGHKQHYTEVEIKDIKTK